MHVFSKGCDERAYLISLAIHMQNIFVFRYFPQNLRFFRSHVYQVSHKLTFPYPNSSQFKPFYGLQLCKRARD